MPKAQELNPIMRSTGPANSVGAPFRSNSESFFAPKIKVKPRTANEFLYGNRAQPASQR